MRVGERRIVPYYLLICLGLEFAIWYADSLVGNAVTVVRIFSSRRDTLAKNSALKAIIGLLLGPSTQSSCRSAPKSCHRTARCRSSRSASLQLCAFCRGAQLTASLTSMHVKRTSRRSDIPFHHGRPDSTLLFGTSTGDDRTADGNRRAVVHHASSGEEAGVTMHCSAVTLTIKPGTAICVANKTSGTLQLLDGPEVAVYI